MICLMCSAGLRCGALLLLRIRDLIPVEIADGLKIFKIIVYAKSKKSCYFTWCTPEARHHIQLYLDNRKRWGERLTEDSPLFRADYNQRAATRGEIKTISIGRIRHIVGDTLRSCGLRTVSLEKEGKPFQRQRANIMANHGLRKFFESNAFKAGMDLMYIRRLMGQKSGELEEAYLQIGEQELLEGDSKHVGYVGIIDQLTIDESNRLKRENQTLRVNRNNWEALRQELDELKEMFKPKP
jgi:integrase